MSEHEWKNIQNDFYHRWNFSNCLGAIDGKHVLIRCPSRSGSEYFNYKNSFSVILMAVADANYCFTYIDVGTNGRVNDARAFSKSSLYKALKMNILQIPTEGVFVADDAFPLRTDILKPYSRTGNLTETQKVFNYRLSRARRIVENAFGILTSRFRVYEKLIPLAIQTVPKLDKATCSLHNWLQKISDNYITVGNIDSEDIQKSCVNKGSWRQNPRNGIANLINYASNNHKKSAANKRNVYAEKFMTTEAVPWQWKMIT